MFGQPAVKLTTLVSFNGTNGSSPDGELVLGADGNFYGTTGYGGTNAPPGNNGYGTVFRMSLDGTLTSLVSFDGISGWLPQAGLTQDSQGNLFGSTIVGGTNNYPYFGVHCGNIFQITTNGTLTSIFSFDDTNGAYPGALSLSSFDGGLYGTTQTGGTNFYSDGSGMGTAFRVTPDGNLTTLIEFNGNDGASPLGQLAIGRQGELYGTTPGGGYGNAFGTAFKLLTNGTLTTLVTFDGTNGAQPTGGLILGKDGNLYGTTGYGGTNSSQGTYGIGNGSNYVFGFGVVFQLATDGTLALLVNFNGTNGGYPRGSLLHGPDGKLYGTTRGGSGSAGNGTIFQVSLDGTFKTLIMFNGTNGSAPSTGVVLGPDGNLYGTTSAGGAFGVGTAFRLTVPMTPVLQPVLSSIGQFVFSWNSVAGLNYQVQYKADPGSTNWANAGSVITASSGTTFQTNAVTGAQGFYRVLLVP